jgi:hypothetical protein
MPRILFTGFDNTGTQLTNVDITDSNTFLMVGQQIELDCSLGSNAPALSNFSWTVPPTTEIAFYVSGDDNYGYAQPLDPSMLTNSDNVEFFWVDGATNGLAKTVSCSADVFGHRCTASANFTLFRPAVAMTTNTGSVIITNEDDSTLWMDFGIDILGQTGIFISNTLVMPPEFTNSALTNAQYDIEWVQLIVPPYSSIMTVSNSPTNVLAYTNQTLQTVLDTRYPCDDPQLTNAIIDSPGLELFAANQIASAMTQNSEMWLMFRPRPIGWGDWVPLWIVSWNCTGTANGFGTNTTNWSLSGTNISISSSCDSGTRYPIWTNNVTNIDINNPPR